MILGKIFIALDIACKAFAVTIVTLKATQSLGKLIKIFLIQNQFVQIIFTVGCNE